MKRKRAYKRGYPVALLIGFERDHAVLWQVFSHVVKPCLTLKLDGKRTDRKALYNFHETVVDALRTVFKEGTRSIVVTAPMKTTYAADFLDHVRKHHAYLIQSERPGGATFAQLVGSADQPYKVTELVKTGEFHEIVAQTTSKEADQIISALEKHFYTDNTVVLYSLKEIEDAVYDQKGHDALKTGYLMLTDKYLADSADKSKIYRLLQISENKKVRTRIVKADTPAGKRISQFGGIVLFTAPTRA